MHHMVFTGRLFSLFGGTFCLKYEHRIKVEAGSSMFLSAVDTHLPRTRCHEQVHYNMNLHCPRLLCWTFVSCFKNVLRWNWHNDM